MKIKNFEIPEGILEYQHKDGLLPYVDFLNDYYTKHLGGGFLELEEINGFYRVLFKKGLETRFSFFAEEEKILAGLYIFSLYFFLKFINKELFEIVEDFIVISKEEFVELMTEHEGIQSNNIFRRELETLMMYSFLQNFLKEVE